ncbi:hypothetical protein VTN02DRAFT_6032 [Thermoascus thermophilus]
MAATVSASTAAADPGQSISSFRPAVLSHLKRIYGILSTVSHRPEFFATVQQETSADGSNGDPDGDPLSSFATFLAYMASPASSATGPSKERDFSAPISNYFISSSHNTYLTGNQLYSDADTRSYTDALLRGCRCLEIDVWDGDEDSASSEDDDDDASSSSSSSSSEDGAVKNNGEDRTKDRKQKREKSESNKRLSFLSNKFHRLMKRGSPSEAPPVATVAGSAAPPGSGVAEKIASIARPEPRVLHGYTLTKEITFREVCYAIRDSAFVTSDLPVIVSLEVHASLEQQETMVEIMQEAWKGLLVTPDPEAGRLPSPGELKRKILIKTKWAPPPTGDNADDGINELDDAFAQGKSAEEEDVPAESITASKSMQKKKAKTLHALSQLAVYTRAYHFSDFTQPEATIPTHVFSLSEAAARDAHANKRQALFEHNRNFMMRVYPSGMRVNSSNLDPSFFWRQGVQMVALNWQNQDKGMMLNEAMFAGEQGWVLKPTGYRSADGGSEGSIVRHTVALSLEIFAGQSLPLPPGDSNEKSFRPYVRCELLVEQPEDSVEAKNEDSNDSRNAKYKRRTKACSGINPDFGGETLTFSTAPGVVEKLSFLRFIVKDDEFGRDDLAAWACVRLDRLQGGYRLVHLFDAKGRKSEGFLLVKITKVIS